MFHKFLVTADTHLTGSESDNYRWSLFTFLEEKAKEHECEDIIISGDLSDFKDNHGSIYVNRAANAIEKLAQVARVHILMGNHDMIQEDHPYFEFLDKIHNVFYHKKVFSSNNVVLLPYTKTPHTDFKDIELKDGDTVFMHQPVIGAKSSDFYELQHGMDGRFFSKTFKDMDLEIWSGDIHIYQDVGDVQYIGAPYQIRFNDGVDGRILLFTPDNVHSIPFCPMQKLKVVIDKPSDLRKKKKEIVLNDCIGFQNQIKVVVTHSDDAYVAWKEWKKEINAICKGLGVVCAGIELEKRSMDKEELKKQKNSIGMINASTGDALRAYAKQQKLNDYIEAVGSDLLEESESV